MDTAMAMNRGSGGGPVVVVQWFSDGDGGGG